MRFRALCPQVKIYSSKSHMMTASGIVSLQYKPCGALVLFGLCRVECWYVRDTSVQQGEGVGSCKYENERKAKIAASTNKSPTTLQSGPKCLNKRRASNDSIHVCASGQSHPS